MANVTITASSVVPSANSLKSSIQLGEAADAGDIVYFKSSDAKWYLANATTLEESGNGAGSNLKMLASSGAANQYVVGVDPKSSITVGAVLTKGRAYVLSATDGLIANEGDLTSGQFLTIVGYAITSSVLFFDPTSTGVTI